MPPIVTYKRKALWELYEVHLQSLSRFLKFHIKLLRGWKF